VPPTFLKRSAEEAMSNAPRVLKASTSDAMRKIMRMNVVKGTGRRANAEGYRVGGKTGTAEKVVRGRYSNSALLTSFLAAFPMDDPQYVVLVMLDEPQRVAASRFHATAGLNAAPTLGKIVARIGPILGVTPRADEGRRRFDAKVSATY
jgi:cell division protein FtsI (penicillin-binding protein 3)